MQENLQLVEIDRPRKVRDEVDEVSDLRKIWHELLSLVLHAWREDTSQLRLENEALLVKLELLRRHGVFDLLEGHIGGHLGDKQPESKARITDGRPKLKHLSPLSTISKTCYQLVSCRLPLADCHTFVMFLMIKPSPGRAFVRGDNEMVIRFSDYPFPGKPRNGNQIS